ncbi:hypothetical protein N7E81_11835 [Reichenbachiella carrageenanivorans]|uniref:Uncharacterized protein n=1 Tax=Reichenbachiella carrageenanivorans TaxID=2979869 RepID=A0ABY6DC18_9BACT|nr:hypothetical protein [Reichenbachiella carrageenanivorans]UXX81395.1 hypothetical protein N7E81_11835 [Reichenbachiella carrageenanivorans]
MTLIIFFLAGAVLLQIGILVYSRKLKKSWNKEDVLHKYNIKSRSELFAALNRQDISKEDLIKLNDIYIRQSHQHERFY